MTIIENGKKRSYSHSFIIGYDPYNHRNIVTDYYSWIKMSTIKRLPRKEKKYIKNFMRFCGYESN